MQRAINVIVQVAVSLSIPDDGRPAEGQRGWSVKCNLVERCDGEMGKQQERWFVC